MKIKSLLTALLMLCFVAAQAQTPTADEILANYFKATGGLEKWKALKSRTSTGKSLYGSGVPG